MDRQVIGGAIATDRVTPASTGSGFRPHCEHVPRRIAEMKALAAGEIVALEKLAAGRFDICLASAEVIGVEYDQRTARRRFFTAAKPAFETRARETHVLRSPLLE